MKKIAICGAYPVETLTELGCGTPAGHHATWLPRISKILEGVDGIEVHWVAVSKQVEQATSVVERGQTFHVLPRRSLALSMLTGFWSDRRRIAALLADLAPDLVHCWGTEDCYGYVAADWGGESILSMQGLLQVYCQACPQPLLLRLQAWHEARVLASIRRVTVESPWGRDHLKRLAPQAEVSLLEYGADKACFEATWNPVDDPLVLFVGTLSVLKGVDVLLEAFQDERLDSVQLVLLGDGPLMARRFEMGPNVRFLGHCRPEEVRKWMTRAWCLVHPTRADTSPNAVKEARAIGLPVITTPHGGQTQYVEHEKSGFIGQLNDLEALVKCILVIVANAPPIKWMGDYGRSHCRDLLAPAKTRESLKKLYGDSDGC